jgi:N-acetylmuramoyl-L-alanine amidase
MIRRMIAILMGASLLAGCVYEREPAPQIVSGPAPLKVPVPAAARPTVVRRPPQPGIALEEVPTAWIPPAGLQRAWTAIVLHHSATPTGNAAIFDQWHREGNHWDGVGYDFVIGNGSDSADGEVEATFRWTHQRTGAHTGGTPDNWANEEAIGICLVGDFNHSRPTAAQMQSLARLVHFLEERYAIPPSRIYGHGTTPGARPTDCPGGRFPMAEFLAMLDGHQTLTAK